MFVVPSAFSLSLATSFISVQVEVLITSYTEVLSGVMLQLFVTVIVSAVLLVTVREK